MKNLAEKMGINIIVSCRQNLWHQVVRGTESYEQVEIRGFDSQQAERLLYGVALPENMRGGPNRTPKAFVLTPLIVSILIEIRDQHPHQSVAFQKRTEVFEKWALSACDKGATRLGISADALLGICERVAIARVRKRIPTLPISMLPDLMPETLGNRILRADELSVTGIFELRDDATRITFFHESMYEFFIARALKHDFERVMELADSDPTIGLINLATVDLDYPQSAIYGFLSEMLPSYVEGLQARLEKTGIDRLNGKVLRNLVEFLGMTYLGPAEQVVRSLLRIAENGKNDEEVRFNALRALERIHPRAPRPYFIHVSDWGEKDYAELDKIGRDDQSEQPWVVRGHGKKTPVPGLHWSWVPNNTRYPLSSSQTEVSSRLAKILRDSLESTDALWLRVNCSHAWIRWFDVADLIF